ncbi:UDP-N-acetylglucosamine 4,6-dehydratase (inverting) [Terasakiella sp. SH-1]|uniref:UDP-N-acetylglucosamine 4,6-dehydratase (inverting) n=1 Tax=Terasakiella sp. SH-1 TaxID=2560057 RepID=UPI001073B827|nr:UDP-N-acetylglucosamine 4,6-dehydratase (inverting) [Terasakiella sp. SH-1]
MSFFQDRFNETPKELLDRKSILVTGGTGSFGKHFIKTILENYTPSRLIIFSRDELKQHEMQVSALFPEDKTHCLRYFIGDVRDRRRLHMAMKGVDYVIHAAAMKQVPASEYNPFECINTNVLGAQNIVEAAIENNVKKVIALSTDKACSPVNLYGASKLASDKVFLAANNLSSPDGTLFSCVRYGNVVGSRGSVVPFFKNLIDNGSEELPITDERMTRFWITLDQGVSFVLTTLEQMQGAEIFVPKIPSMKITDLALAMKPDCKFKIIGIRPGEKLHEVMISSDDSRTTVERDDRYIILSEYPWTDRFPLAKKDGHSVPEGFSYASDTNTEWLGAEELVECIKS